jgi:hypothetical protein
MDQEKGSLAAVQKSPYHLTLIPGYRMSMRSDATVAVESI